MMIYNSLNEAYNNVLYDILVFGDRTSPRGRETKELLGYSFTITNPRDRLVFSENRKLNLFFCIGNFLWVMSKSNKLDYIKYYNPRGVNFSHDGEILPGAYGKRIFDIDGVNQYEQCIKELKIDPDSRRAIISIHLPQHDWRGYLDTPCTSDFQLFIRNGKLHMINHMRSQSAAMVMPYDIFLMTMIQEYMALELGVELGYYQHICNSIHYFREEEEFVEKIIEEKTTSIEMPKMDNITDLKEVLKLERELRLNIHNPKDKINLSPYWTLISSVLVIKRLIENNNKEYKNRLDELHDSLSFFLRD